MTGHMLGGERPPIGAVWWALLALYLFAALAEAEEHRTCLHPAFACYLGVSLSAGPRTLSVEAPVHGPEVLCLYVILALLEIYNHFRQSHARQLMSVYRYTGD